MRMPAPRLLATALAGLVAGAMLSLALGSRADQPTPEPVTGPAGPDAFTPLAEDESGLLLAWSPGGIDQGVAEAIAALPAVERVTVVDGDRVDLVGSWRVDGDPVDALDPGWAIPLDALAVDPESYAEVLPGSGKAGILQLLEPGGAVLSESSSSLRRLVVGARLQLTRGPTLIVRAVVDDALVGAAELVVSRDDGTELGIVTPRFVLVTHEGGDRAAMETALRQTVGGPVRVRGTGETAYLRHGDAVLPQAIVKVRFGEFAYQPPTSGREFVQDSTWQRENLVTETLPLLGRMTCHGAVMPAIRGALTELADDNLGHLIDAGAFAGCHNARLTSNIGAVSHHAWGLALDVNYDENQTGLTSSQDPRLVAVFDRWGFTWGGFWVMPDPAHFEYLRPPTDVAVKVPSGQ